VTFLFVYTLSLKVLVVIDFKNWPALGSSENGEADHGG
jgi:hypothetical protein